jgi:hypothetical protein
MKISIFKFDIRISGGGDLWGFFVRILDFLVRIPKIEEL